MNSGQDDETTSIVTAARDDSQLYRSSWRVFCAVDLPDNVPALLMDHIKRLRAMVPNAEASWSREENIHLTIKFLGQISVSRVGDLSSAAARTAAGCSPFSISVEETGVFPNYGKPRVLWIGVKDESGKLAELHTRFEKECAREGLPVEARSFSPHLTIARLRKPQFARALGTAHEGMTFKRVPVRVEQFSVIRSGPGSSGSKYTVISTHPLGG
jgi:2'-5' RNA ligase